MKLNWSLTIHNIQNQPNLYWINRAKAHINPYLNAWIPFKGFKCRILQTWLQNIYGSNYPNSLYIILYIRDPTVDPYSTVYLHCPKSVHNFSLGHTSVSYIPLSVWYTLITPPWLWYSLFKNTFYKVWRHYIELESNKFLNYFHRPIHTNRSTIHHWNLFHLNVISVTDQNYLILLESHTS